MKLNSLELPENLYWQNEFDHKKIAQSIDRTVSGGVVVESSVLVYGQKIKLAGAWAARTKVLALKSMEEANATMILVDGAGQNHSVVFDIEAGGLVAPLVMSEINPSDDTLYDISLNLVTVEPV